VTATSSTSRLDEHDGPVPGAGLLRRPATFTCGSSSWASRSAPPRQSTTSSPHRGSKAGSQEFAGQAEQRRAENSQAAPRAPPQQREPRAQARGSGANQRTQDSYTDFAETQTFAESRERERERRLHAAEQHLRVAGGERVPEGPRCPRGTWRPFLHHLHAPRSGGAAERQAGTRA
jgi:hypothetical protein